MPLQMLRIIDANCNRISEGLRFLEDIARFILNNAQLSQQIRASRHHITSIVSNFGAELFSERNAEEDVGASTKLFTNQHDLPALIKANAKRAEEGLRVIEELAKLPEISPIINSIDIQQIRFLVYTVEKNLLSQITRQQKTTRLHGVYVIIDTEIAGDRDEIKLAQQVIKGGAKIIQFRDKHYSNNKRFNIAKRLKELCSEYNVLFIINDYLDIALTTNADGIHIGQDDLPLPIVRKEMPFDKLIGCSTLTIEQALKAESEGADYIAIGSIFATSTKTGALVVGLKRITEIKQKVTLPIVAIGGIHEANLRRVITAGADSAAVISAVLNQDNIEAATQRLVNIFEKAK